MVRATRHLLKCDGYPEEQGESHTWYTKNGTKLKFGHQIDLDFGSDIIGFNKNFKLHDDDRDCEWD